MRKSIESYALISKNVLVKYRKIETF